MNKALITGGAGFIGSNLAEKLIEQGVEVIIYDNLFLGDEKNIPEEAEFVKGTVLDSYKLQEQLGDVDTVFHFAAHSNSLMHKDHPAKSARVNIEGFITVVEAAIIRNVDKIVYASTSSVYGDQDTPYKETGNEKPVNRYAASKKAREEYAKRYSDELNITGLRYFSVYGGNEKHKENYANIITQFTWAMKQGNRPVIWGDGSQQRDFIHVKDAVEATLRASQKKDSLNGEVINVGTGKATNFNTVVKTINKHLDKQEEIIPIYKEDRQPENYVLKHRADTEKMEKLLKFKPETSVEKGIEKVVKNE